MESMDNPIIDALCSEVDLLNLLIFIFILCKDSLFILIIDMINIFFVILEGYLFGIVLINHYFCRVLK